MSPPSLYSLEPETEKDSETEVGQSMGTRGQQRPDCSPLLSSMELYHDHQNPKGLVKGRARQLFRGKMAPVDCVSPSCLNFSSDGGIMVSPLAGVLRVWFRWILTLQGDIIWS